MARIIDLDTYRQSKRIKVTDIGDHDTGYDYYPSDCDYDDYYYENDDDFPVMDP